MFIHFPMHISKLRINPFSQWMHLVQHDFCQISLQLQQKIVELSSLNLLVIFWSLMAPPFQAPVESLVTVASLCIILTSQGYTVLFFYHHHLCPLGYRPCALKPSPEEKINKSATITRMSALMQLRLSNGLNPPLSVSHSGSQSSTSMAIWLPRLTSSGR